MKESFIHLQRESSGVEHTYGILTFDDFKCSTIEDEYRETKLHGETRIPDGTYEILLRTEGGMHQKYLDRFKDFHIGMLWLQDVPDFEWIYIHPMTTDLDSLGCIGVGYKRGEHKGRPAIFESGKAYTDLYKMIAPKLIEDGKVFITIRG